ncbi:MAG: serpin family protein [Clostridiales bacterium]|nr:serpin family protein [Clostridiales bacterium]
MKQLIAALTATAVIAASATACGGKAPLAAVKYPDKIGDDRMGFYEQNELDDSFKQAVDSFAYRTADELLADGEGNANYSPISLYFALAMAAEGASGETKAEIVSLIGDEYDGSVAEQCARLYRRLYNAGEHTTLKIANSVWSSVPLKLDFAKSAAENFYSEAFEVDFGDSSTGKQIGNWISKQTGGTLKPQIVTDPEQLVSIINTIYYIDEWTDKFEKSQNTDGIFHTPDGDVETTFMNRGALGGFSRGDGYTRATLGLKGGSMTFVLPDEGIGARELIARVGMEELLTGGESCYGDITWSVPKFSFDSKFKLCELVSKLGVSSIFTNSADFSLMSDEPMFVSDIEQGTHIAIDEKGVSASAYTAIMYCGAAMPTDHADMILDRPFIYAITSGGQTLFVGVVENPNE